MKHAQAPPPETKFFTVTLPDGKFWIKAESARQIARVLGIKENFIKPGADPLSIEHVSQSQWLGDKNSRRFTILAGRKGKTSYFNEVFDKYMEIVGL